jgi:hypothetical protein
MLGRRLLMSAAVVGAVFFTTPAGVSVAATPRLWVANGPSLVEFEANASGNVSPIAVISGPDTQLGNPTSVAVDPAGNVWAADLMNGPKVLEFRAGSEGDTAPVATLAGSDTHITETYGIWFDAAGHLFLGNLRS